MTRRIFVTVSRGMTDKTAVCIFPWEKPILEQIHGGEVAEVSIEDLCDLKGPVKVEKNKDRLKRQDGVESEPPPDLRAQLEAMCAVDDEDDPVNDPEGEYGRLVDKYGMDKDVPLPVVTRVYGEFISGAFAAALKQAAGSRKRAGKAPDEMSINELRSALRAEKIDFEPTATKDELRDLLTTATA